MPAAFTIRVLQSIIRIEFDQTLGAEDVEALQRPWHALEVDEPHDATIHVAVGRTESHVMATAVRAANVAEAAQSLATAVTVEGIARLRGHALLLHAAGIALDDGSVIGFIGPSGRGKTTAARELCQHWGYVTDETLAVRTDLSVIPYPKPLSVLIGNPPKHSIAPASLGMRSLPPEPLILTALVILDRRPGVEMPFVEPVDLAEALGLVAPETSSLIALPRPLGDLVDVIQRTGGVRRVVYSEAAQLPALVPTILAIGGSRSENIADIPMATSRSGGSAPVHEGVYRRGPVEDAVRIGGQIAVHDGQRVIVLDGLGPELWQAADGATFDELVSYLTRLFPPPPGIDTVAEIERLLDVLCESGLLAHD